MNLVGVMPPSLILASASPSRRKMLINAGLSFDIEPERRDALILGLDAIGTTLQRRDAIVSFETSYLRQNPWLV